MTGSNGNRRARPTTTERGYGWEHQQARKRLEPVVRAGRATCTKCGFAIEPWAEWHLDHDESRRGYLGAAHAVCNSTAPHRRRVELEDDEARGVFWGPGGRRWTRPWFDWRTEPLTG